MEAIEIKQRYDALWGIRKTVEQDWDLIEKFIAPLRGGKFFQEQSSEHEIDWRRGRDVFDSTAILASNTLASSIHGALTSPSTRWFSLRFRDDDLNLEDKATEWLQACSERIWYALQDSDFNLEVNEAYQDLVAFGTSCVIEEAESEVEWKGIDFSTLPVREIYFEQNHKGQIEHFYRRLQWTPLQIITKFGDKVPEHIKEQAKQPGQADHKITVIYAVYPRKGKEDADVTKLLAPKQRPFESKYIIHSNAEQVGEVGGYYEMPAFIPRYQKTSGSMWGFGAGTIAISDVMTLNAVVEQRLSAAAKAIDPPSLVTERGLLSDLDLEPGGLTVVRDINGAKPYESGARFDVTEGMISDLRNSVNRMFLVDRLELKESPAMTATEVNARYDLMQRLLGPVFGRLQSDFLDPMLERTFRIMFRAGQLPPMPEELADANAELDIEYIGPMGRAQKSDMLSAMSQWMRDMAELGELYPELRMLPDAQAYGREMAKAANIPATIVRSKEEVDEMINQEQQAKLQQQQLEQAGLQGQAMQAMGDGAQALQEAGVEGGPPQ
ncbi:MAG: portal protein [Thiohalomonadales bacterium]